jgi:hypothetical protein
MVEQVEAGIARPLTVSVSARELADMELGACEGCTEEPQPLRVGLVKPVTARASLVRPSWGAVKSTYDAGRVWSAAVRSEGAFGLRLHFKRFRLPEDTELYLFNELGEVAGPYTGWGPLGTGEFWSNMVTGDTVYLQLRQYGPAGPEKLAASWFDLVDVGPVTQGFGWSPGSMAKSFCSYNETCVENAGCGTDSAVNDAKDAVAYMLFVKRPFQYACSGGLLNTKTYSGTPYFLTANHCISSDRVASTLEAYFQYWVSCNQGCPDEWSRPDTTKVLGSSVVATNKTGDFTLLLLDALPAGATLLGWNSAPVAFSNGTNLYRISHPSTAPQAYSEHVVDTSALTCSSWPRGSWIYSRDTYGATEGGSSGSPVVDGLGRVVGQLSGACGSNVNDVCDSANNATVDGAFASYYSQVAQWLDPAGCSTDEDHDGYVAESCGGDDCNDGNALVNPGMEEICGDNIDNNCDGTSDEGCGACLPAGDACTANDQCCSGLCHPKRHVCK